VVRMKKLAKTLKGDGKDEPPPTPSKPTKFKNFGSNDAPSFFNDEEDAPPVPPRQAPPSRGGFGGNSFEEDDEEDSPPVPPRRSMGERHARKSISSRANNPPPSSNGGAGYSWESSGGGGGDSSYSSNDKSNISGVGGGYSWESSGGGGGGGSASSSNNRAGGGGGYSFQSSGGGGSNNDSRSRGDSWQKGGFGGGMGTSAAPKPNSSQPSTWTLPRNTGWRKPQEKQKPSSNTLGRMKREGGYQKNARGGWSTAPKLDADKSWMRRNKHHDDDDARAPAPPRRNGGGSGGGGYSWETGGSSSRGGGGGSSWFGGGGGGSGGGYSWETNQTSAQPKRNSGTRRSLMNGVKRLSGLGGFSRGGDNGGPGPGMVQYPYDSGCYLSLDIRGNLIMNWSEDGVAPEHCLACFQPYMQVKRFKYKQNGGRQELFQTKNDKKKLLEGIAQFVKEALQYNATVVVLPSRASNFDVYFFTFNTAVVHMELDHPYNTKSMDSVAVLPKSNSTFRGMGNTSRGHFLTQGARAGFSLSL